VFATTALIDTITAVITTITMALAPAPRPLGMSKPAAPRALVSAGALAPGRAARQARARPAAVAVTTVTVAAQHDLSTAQRAQEQAGWWVHAHLGEPKVLDGLVRGGPHCCGTAFIGTV
jgi:hypothetical protein